MRSLTWQCSKLEGTVTCDLCRVYLNPMILIDCLLSCIYSGSITVHRTVNIKHFVLIGWAKMQDRKDRPEPYSQD